MTEPIDEQIESLAGHLARVFGATASPGYEVVISGGWYVRTVARVAMEWMRERAAAQSAADGLDIIAERPSEHDHWTENGWGRVGYTHAHEGGDMPHEHPSNVEIAPSAPEKTADDRHYIEFSETKWAIQHPLSCRPNLLDCAVHHAVEEVERENAVPPMPPGRYLIDFTDEDPVYLPLDSADEKASDGSGSPTREDGVPDPASTNRAVSDRTSNPEPSDALYLRLKGAREKLCLAQTLIKGDDAFGKLHRQMLGEAIHKIDIVGGARCEQWSRFDREPSNAEAADEGPFMGPQEAPQWVVVCPNCGGRLRGYAYRGADLTCEGCTYVGHVVDGSADGPSVPDDMYDGEYVRALLTMLDDADTLLHARFGGIGNAGNLIERIEEWRRRCSVITSPDAADEPQGPNGYIEGKGSGVADR